MLNNIKKGSTGKKGYYVYMPGSDDVIVDMKKVCTCSIVGYGASLYSDNYYRISISDDGENWTNLRRAASSNPTFHFENQTGRYVLFHKPNSTGTMYGAVVWE